MRIFAAPPPAAGSRAGEVLRVLLLEDSDLDATLLESRLEDEGLSFSLTRVQTRAAFDEAVAGCRFDVILSDYNVPGFDGLSALAASHLGCPDVPFIFVTGALGEERAIDLLKKGATDYVLKDRLERLVPSIDRALREANEKAERRRAERSLQLALEATELGTWVWDLKRQALRCDARNCVLLGQPPGVELKAGAWAAAIHDEDRARVLDASAAVIASNRGEQLQLEYRILRPPDGEERWLAVHGRVESAEDGSPSRLVGTTLDVTDRKRAEAELRARAEFEAQLVGIVSHDLRNPLHAITVSAAMLVRQETLDERSSKGARRILASAERATRMIRDLLDFTQARLGGGIPVEVEPIELQEPVAAVVEELRHTHPERELTLEADGDTRVIADSDRVGQMVANLVGNALKYSAAGSPVTVRIRSAAEELLLEVHNQGAPIPPEQLTRLFKPLSRLESKVDLQTRSIGLGLYIVDSIARAHRGRVEVRSTQQEGTTFTVRLPRG